MSPGDYILNILHDVPFEERTILLMRHSKRDSVKGIPDHMREGVEITAEGIQLARSFGVSLGQILPEKSIRLGHTVAHRCKMTAESIGDGYSNAGQVRHIGIQPDVGNVVVNPDEYVKLRNELGWQQIIQMWLNEEIPEETLQNPHKYARNIVGQLISCSDKNHKDILIVIAHDVTILPVLYSVFGKTITAIEFLNGIVITGNSSSPEIRYNDAELSLKAELRLA